MKLLHIANERANWTVNCNAKFADEKDLIQYVRETVQEQFGKKLDPEVVYVSEYIL